MGGLFLIFSFQLFQSFELWKSLLLEKFVGNGAVFL